MLSLLVLLLFGILVGVFAVQNTQSTSVILGPYWLQNVPLYGVILGAILFGIFVSWLVSLGGLVSTSMNLRGKEGRIRDAERKIQELEDRNHNLEIENERLRNEEPLTEENPSPSPFVKLRQRFS